MSVFTGICKSSGIFLDFEVIQQYSISEFSSSTTVLQFDIIFSSQYGVFNSFVLPKVSCVTLGNSILAENKDWIWWGFFSVIVFSCPVWRFCRQIFHITSFMGYFWGKNVRLGASNKTQLSDCYGCLGQGTSGPSQNESAWKTACQSPPCQSKAESPLRHLKNYLQ